MTQPQKTRINTIGVVALTFLGSTAGSFMSFAKLSGLIQRPETEAWVLPLVRSEIETRVPLLAPTRAEWEDHKIAGARQIALYDLQWRDAREDRTAILSKLDEVNRTLLRLTAAVHVADTGPASSAPTQGGTQSVIRAATASELAALAGNGGGQ